VICSVVYGRVVGVRIGPGRLGVERE